MIRLRKTIYLAFAFLLLHLLQPLLGFAQLGIGFTYEKREIASQDLNKIGLAEYGFGVRIENDFNIRIPFMKFGWRMHASAFSAETSFSDQFNDVIDQNISANIIDAGFGLLGEIKMPLFANPYFGGGLGYEKQSLSYSEEVECVTAPCPNIETFVDGYGLYYNAVLGLKFSPIPLLKPFVEYRYTGYTTSKSILESPGRLQLGVLLEF